MVKIRNIIGERFGRLVVIKLGKRPENSKATNVYWTCGCDCGETITTSSANLRNGSSQSCGCLHSERVRKSITERSTVHGHRPSAGSSLTYISWRSMWTRCTNPKHRSYPRYGGRGIIICDRWRSFPEFLEDMGPRPKGKTLDRIKNDGNYEPGNCRWATPKQQRANQS